MKDLTLNSWEEFEEKLDELDLDRKRLLREKSHVSRFLFRGQSNSKWRLETTLERFTADKVSLTQYYEFAYAAKSKIETFTEKKWQIPCPPNFRKRVKRRDNIQLLFNMPGYEYFAYLRHHGYPSPLLDWTASPYIAAFFAFRNVAPAVDLVSVYVYLECAGSGKIGSNNAPSIKTFGPYATIHRRHVLQQSSYTICAIREGDDFIFDQHDRVSSTNREQDIFWKLNIPTSERVKALHVLNKMNINAYSLFSTVDSLMEATAISESENRFKDYSL